MSIFTENLPLTVVVDCETEYENKLQGQFVKISEAGLVVFMPEEDMTEYIKTTVKIVFFVNHFEFYFNTHIINYKESSILIAKPKEIHKKKQRISSRLDISLAVLYSPWDSIEKKNTFLINLSADGCKMYSEKRLKKGLILNISFRIKIDSKTVPIISKAIVVWSKKDEDDEQNQFLNGIKFTTISNENVKRIDKVIDFHLRKQMNDQEEIADPTTEKASHSLYLAALNDIQKKHFPLAIHKLAKIVQNDSVLPDSSKIKQNSILALGKVYIYESSFKDALNMFKLFLNKFENNSKIKSVYFSIAYCYDKLKLYTNAIEHYKKVITLTPNDTHTEKAKNRIRELLNR